MDAFQDRFWNLDQVRAWAETRDVDLVGFAGVSSIEIAIRAELAATRLSNNGRDLQAELWKASGSKRPSISFIPPTVVQKAAEKEGVPWYFLYQDKDLQVRSPIEPTLTALLEAWVKASDTEKKFLTDYLYNPMREEKLIKTDPGFEKLTPKIKQFVNAYISGAERHGPPHVFRYVRFPTERYLLELLRAGKLSASGNLTGEPLARAISPMDWAGLEIRVGGDGKRLGVWRLGKTPEHGASEIENVRILSEAVLKEFPANAPNLDETLDSVLLEAANRTDDGKISQAAAFAAVRAADLNSNRKDVIAAIKKLEIGGKQGRKKKPRNSA